MKEMHQRDYDLLAEILYVASLHLDKEVYIELITKLAKIFRKQQPIKFNSKKFLQNCGYFDLML